MKLAVLCSLILSILHSTLFYGQKWGISIFLFTIVGMFLFIYILEKNNKIKNKKALLLSIPIIILSLTYFLFNNSFFNFLNIIVIILLFLIMTIISVIGELRLNKLFENFFILFFGPIEELGEATKEFSNCFTKKNEENKKEKNILLRQIGKGILYSSPLLIIIIILLITADEMFASIFGNIFKTIFNFINIKTIYSMLFRIFIIIILTLYFLGLIIKIKNNKLNENRIKTENKIKIEGIILNTLLTSLNIIYLIFAITQGIYLVNNIISNNITDYANYARTGFFQLMVVSLINFVVILISKNNAGVVSNKNKRYNKIMNVLLSIFTIIILISSVIRMNLYQNQYGYTFLRLLVYFIQITELMTIIPTIVYIIKDKFNIVKWYMSIAILMYIIINFTNLDYIIAKGNIDRYYTMDVKERKIDFAYLENNTNTDAIPEIIRLLDTEDKKLKRRVNNYLLNVYDELQDEKSSFQSFNISKHRAKEKLKELDLKYMPYSDYNRYNY